MARTIAALALLVLASTTTVADTLLIDGIEMDSQTAAARPKPGMSMTSVESTFGSPAERHGAVGQPPITRWDYSGFSVYFEHDRVIHAVARREAN
jgi:outer membrane protein assembly factor BamE (lipoprotein component of BamABCDE complex)